MSSKKLNKQSGFAFIIVLIVAAAIGTGGTVSYAKVKQSQNQKIAQEQQQAAEQKATDAKAMADQKKEEAKTASQETPKPEEAPAPTTPKPVETPKPAPAPNITPVSAEGCDSYITVYASKSGGTPLYKDYGAAYNRGEVSMSIPYGASLQVKCQDGDVAAALYNGTEGAVVVKDLSKTKP